jgi:hypothetical protein
VSASEVPGGHQRRCRREVVSAGVVVAFATGKFLNNRCMFKIFDLNVNRCMFGL